MKLAWILWMTTILPQPMAAQTCLATTIYLEARSQPTIGQFAVAEVALRRRQEGRWGKTVCDVVKYPHQFATTVVSPNYQLGNLKAWTKAWKIAGESLAIWNLPKGKRMLVVPHADHFATRDSSPHWATVAALRTIGDHAFYAVN
ncbi:MAG TPA: cell wall hydrolase [Rhodanobacteraceae bacterium]|nr:cell wall hydrolase [Rhodanobacteraceae bacterium]HET8553726.1 cell wall hydrolase [Rhodanobacteraceae bacterium]